ncbi:MAG: WG repeat-containing protein [Neisseria sp.]|nr:WG repeat-containing protein [Neisseria sp.]
MKKILTLLIGLLLQPSFAHAEEALFYFENERGHVGVRSGSGKVLIAPQFSNVVVYDYDKPIAGQTIELLTRAREFQPAQAFDQYRPATPAGEVYDRRGRLLYRPQVDDNGMDEWSEGLRRYVENGKIGFVDRAGNKVLPAEWTFATPFQYGYAEVMTGNWRKRFDASGEHWSLEAADSRAESHLIDRQGRRVRPLPQQQSGQDYFYQGKYYPRPSVYFAYNEQERKLLATIAADKRVHRHMGVSDGLVFEITERPREDFPYDTVQAFYRQNGAIGHKSSGILFADSNGELYRNDWEAGGIIPLD